MEENKILNFLNHLEYLGYENVKLNSLPDIYLCKRSNQNSQSFVMASLINLNYIMLRGQFYFDIQIFNKKRLEFYEFINKINSSSLNSCCYVDMENTLVIVRNVLSDEYSRTVFGSRFDDFMKNLEDIGSGLKAIYGSNSEPLDSDEESSTNCKESPYSQRADRYDHNYDSEEDDPYYDKYDDYCNDKSTEDCCWDGCDACDRPDCEEDFDYMSEDGPSNSPCYHNDDFS